jgi:hypothetical protein
MVHLEGAPMSNHGVIAIDRGEGSWCTQKEHP